MYKPIGIMPSSGRHYTDRPIECEFRYMHATKQNASDAILQQLATENRRVLSDWRAMLLLRRATFSLSPRERRWSQIPENISAVHPLLRQMVRRGEIRLLPHLRYLYEVIVPYARRGFVEENEILMEVNPYATVSHFSALVFHGLTNELPKIITVIAPISGTAGILPLGTYPEDWEGLALVHGRQPPRIVDQPVHWTKVKTARLFGMSEYRPHAYPVRVTTPERTLLEGLLNPNLCGGLQIVLRAWKRAADTLSVETLIDYVDAFDVGVLRQRVGFVLDELNISHPATERWQKQAQRGGSSKLIASEGYTPRYSERWNLSLNAPTDALHEDEP